MGVGVGVGGRAPMHRRLAMHLQSHGRAVLCCAAHQDRVNGQAPSQRPTRQPSIPTDPPASPPTPGNTSTRTRQSETEEPGLNQAGP